MILNLLSFVTWYAILLSIGQLFLRIKNIEKLTRSILFISLAIIFHQSWHIITGNYDCFSGIFTIQLTLFYLLGPLLYFTYHMIIFKDNPISKNIFINLFPIGIAVSADLWFFIFDKTIKYKVFNLPTLFDGSTYIVMYKILILGSGIQMSFYLVKLILRITRLWNLKDLNSINSITGIYIILSMISFFIVINSYFFGAIILLKTGAILSSVLLLATYFVSQRYPKFMKLLVEEVTTKSYEKSLLDGINVEKVINKLDNIMIEQKYYADEDLTIKQLAREVNITPHQLSQLLNERLNVNFNTFVNKFRVDEAIKMLLDEQKRSVLSIAYAVGFNSKSSFYEAFSKFTQKTPHKFRKDELDKLK